MMDILSKSKQNKISVSVFFLKHVLIQCKGDNACITQVHVPIGLSFLHHTL